MTIMTISHSFASLTRERYFQHSKIKFVSLSGHVISFISEMETHVPVDDSSFQASITQWWDFGQVYLTPNYFKGFFMETTSSCHTVEVLVLKPVYMGTSEFS